MNNPYVRQANDLTTSYAATRAGFLEYALRKSKESTPYIDRARALKAIAEHQTNSPQDLLQIVEIRQSLNGAAGISEKAKNYLSEADLLYLLQEFIDQFLLPAGDSYIEELVYRYLLTAGDALGGKMRNLVGTIANEKLTRFIISQLQVLQYEFRFYDKVSRKWLAANQYSIEQIGNIRSIQWQRGVEQRQLIYNLTVPIVGKNIDIIVLQTGTDRFTGKEYKQIIENPSNYRILGELKGGIDPAGADEHWKTASTALSRVREAFAAYSIKIPLLFVGAAIENSMAQEIFALYESGSLANCANLTVDEQLSSLCYWLIKL